MSNSSKACLRYLLKVYAALLALAYDIQTPCDECPQTAKGGWIISLNGITIKGDIEMAELREGQRIPLQANFKTANGHPATHEAGTVKWDNSNPDIASLEVDPNDETKAFLNGTDGSANAAGVASCTADGDPDADQTRVLVSTLDYVVTQGEAFVSEIQAGPAEDIPAPVTD